MAGHINSFAQFVSNEDLRKYYDNARSKQKDSIEETLRMINLSKSQNAQDECRGVRDEPEPIKQKNKVNPNIKDL